VNKQTICHSSIESATKKKCLQIRLQCTNVGSDGADRTITGRLIQALDPATANARSPRIVRVLGTYNWPVSADQSQSEHLDEGG